MVIGMPTPMLSCVTTMRPWFGYFPAALQVAPQPQATIHLTAQLGSTTAAEASYCPYAIDGSMHSKSRSALFEPTMT